VIIRINPQSAEPIFEQIIFQVKESVARGELSEGDKLPSVRSLAKDLAVNPNTVIRALEALEREGVVIRRQGAGCFATGRKSTLDLKERNRQLQDLMKRTVTQAYHLGFSSDDIRKALEKDLKAKRFSNGERKSK